MKTKITEPQLRQIVAESIKKVLKESLNEISPEFAGRAYGAARKQAVKAAEDGNNMLSKKRQEQADKFGEYAKDKFNKENGFDDVEDGTYYGIDSYGYNPTTNMGYVSTGSLAANKRGGRSNFDTNGDAKHELDNDANFTRGQQNKIIRGNERISNFMNAPMSDNELEEAVKKSLKKVLKEKGMSGKDMKNKKK